MRKKKKQESLFCAALLDLLQEKKGAQFEKPHGDIRRL
jgi:hypothetical protein